MVDTKQILKENVEEDIRKRIERVKKILDDLRGAIKTVEDNTTQVQEKVQNSTEFLQRHIANRKSELVQQIDTMRHSQISLLQEEIQETFESLGSLQGMLSNLDAFNHSQLLNLRFPEIKRKNPFDQSKIELRMDTVDIVDSANAWQIVKSKDFRAIYDVGMSSSLPKRFVEYIDNKSGQDMYHKPLSPDSPESASDIVCIDQWLSGVKTDSFPENDDFEVISFESPSQTMGFEIQRSDSKSSSKLDYSSKSDESILDLSKWLKPKHKNGPSFDKNVYQPTSTEGKCGAAYSHNPLTNKFVDFPCLREEDPTIWISAKRRRSAYQSSDSVEISKHDGIVPPEYYLPAHFWLRKCY